MLASHSTYLQEADGGSGTRLAPADHRSTVQVTGCLHDLAFFLQWLAGDTGDMCPPMWTVVSGHDNMIHNVHHSMATPHHRLTIFSRTITVDSSACYLSNPMRANANYTSIIVGDDTFNSLL